VPIVYTLSYSDNHVSLFGMDIDILSYSHIYVSTSVDDPSFVLSTDGGHLSDIS
jgi:hypothetical protein